MMSKGKKIVAITAAGIFSLVFTLMVYVDISWAAGDPARGKKIYMANCAVCHGVKGDGKGPAGASLNPPPRNFISKQEMKGISEARMIKSIKEGRPGTAMVSWGNTLSDKDIQDVVAYLETLGGYQK